MKFCGVIKICMCREDRESRGMGEWGGQREGWRGAEDRIGFWKTILQCVNRGYLFGMDFLLGFLFTVFGLPFLLGFSLWVEFFYIWATVDCSNISRQLGLPSWSLCLSVITISVEKLEITIWTYGGTEPTWLSRGAWLRPHQSPSHTCVHSPLQLLVETWLRAAEASRASLFLGKFLSLFYSASVFSMCSLIIRYDLLFSG